MAVVINQVRPYGKRSSSRQHAGAQLGKGGMGGFPMELHGARAEPLKRFKGYRVERISGASVVCVVVSVLFRSLRAAATPGLRAVDRRYEAARG
jgi:hypothetical protein